MAITRDQLSNLTVTSGTSGTTVTVTFSTNPTAGSSVIGAFGINFNGTGSLSSVKDNGTTQSTFTLDKSETGSANHVSYIYRADGISLPASGAYTITLTLSVTGASVSLGAASYLGKLAGGPVATNAATATSASVSTGSVTPSLANSLFVGTFQDNSSGAADNPTVTNGAFTSRLTEGNGSSGQVYGFADAIPANTTAEACTWTVGTSAQYSAAIAVYSPAGTTASAGAVSATAQALQPQAGSVGTASATGTAQAPVANVIPNAGHASATAQALQPTVIVGTLANAGLATATAQALQPGLSISPTVPAGHASATAQALQPTVIVSPNAGHAAATAQALQPVIGIKPGAGLAAATAQALQPRAAILRNPENLGAVVTPLGPSATAELPVYGGTITLADLGATVALANLGASLTGWTMQTATLNILEFNDVTINLAITNNGSAYNLTAATLNMLFKSAAGTPDSEALIFSSAGGSPAITITNAAGGLATVQIPNEDLDTEAYNFYRVDVVVSGFQNTCISGPITWTSL